MSTRNVYEMSETRRRPTSGQRRRIRTPLPLASSVSKALGRRYQTDAAVLALARLGKDQLRTLRAANVGVGGWRWRSARSPPDHGVDEVKRDRQQERDRYEQQRGHVENQEDQGAHYRRLNPCDS